MVETVMAMVVNLSLAVLLRNVHRERKDLQTVGTRVLLVINNLGNRNALLVLVVVVRAVRPEEVRMMGRDRLHTELFTDPVLEGECLPAQTMAPASAPHHPASASALAMEVMMLVLIIVITLTIVSFRRLGHHQWPWELLRTGRRMTPAHGCHESFNGGRLVDFASQYGAGILACTDDVDAKRACANLRD